MNSKISSKHDNMCNNVVNYMPQNHQRCMNLMCTIAYYHWLWWIHDDASSEGSGEEVEGTSLVRMMGSGGGSNERGGAIED